MLHSFKALELNLQIRVSKILYHWILFCFWETQYLHLTTRVFGHSAISPYLGAAMSTWSYDFLLTNAGRRTKFAPVKSLDSSEFSSEFSLNAVISWNGQISFNRIFPSNFQDFATPQISFEFSVFYHTSKSFFMNPINTNLLFSRNFQAERKRRGQGGVMWIENHKLSDANHIAWINLMQSNTTNCAKLGLVTAQRSYIDTSTAQVTAPGLFGGFSFRGLKKLKGGDSWIHSTAQRKEHSKKEFGKKNSKNEFGESETFNRSKFCPVTGVT